MSKYYLTPGELADARMEAHVRTEDVNVENPEEDYQQFPEAEYEMKLDGGHK